MSSFWGQAGRIALISALWALLAEAAVSQEGPRAALRGNILDSPPCDSCQGESRQCGGVPQVNLAVPPENWPPPCWDCDPCDPSRTACPDEGDYFLVPPRPRLYVMLDGAAIRRDPGRRADFASLGLLPTGATVPTDVVLSTGNFNYDFTASGRLVVGQTLNECLQIEAVYLGVSEASNDQAVRDHTPNAQGGVGNLFSPFGGFGDTPILGLDYNNFAQIHYTSSLQSAELNVRRKLPMAPGKLTTSILFGVRYMGIPEEFQYDTATATPAASATSIHVSTGNEMVGPQIGALFEFYDNNRWWVNFEMKAAAMNNRSRQATAYAIGAGPFAGENEFGRREDHTAFAEELQLSFVYRWSSHLTTRIGYQAMWIQNLALASDNFNPDIDIVVQGPADLNHTSSTVYHGPFAGVVLSW